MIHSRHLAWSTVQELMDGDAPVVIAVPGVPAATIRLEVSPPRLTVEIEGASAKRALPLIPDSLDITHKAIAGGHALVMTTQVPAIFGPFYSVATGVIDDVQMGQTPPEAALISALETFRALLATARPRGVAAEVGLVGELLILCGHLRAVGASGVDAWTGPRGAGHDFRLPTCDVEVKTTTRPSRVHTIASIDQLLGLPGRDLYLVSIGIESVSVPADNCPATPLSVPGLAGVALQLASDSPLHFERLARMLEGVGYSPHTASESWQSFVLRLSPHAILVADGCPRIVRHHLAAAIGEEGADRVQNLCYDVDLSHMTSPLETTALRSLIYTET